MRKLVIPQEAIKCHEEKLGTVLLYYLRCLKDGKKLSWNNKGKKQYQANDSKEKAYWSWVCDQFQKEHILTATPNVLLKFAKENLGHLNEIRSSVDKIKDVSDELFAYNRFREGKLLVGHLEGDTKETCDCQILWSKSKDTVANWKGWSLAEFVRLLNVRYCPYCNAETVGVVYCSENPETGESFSAIDHILPKGAYPLLALSLYNLVPACWRCNSQFKGDKDSFDLAHWDPKYPPNALHLYAHDIHQWFRFSYKPSDVAHLFLKPQELTSPLSAMLKTPLDKKCSKCRGNYETLDAPKSVPSCLTKFAQILPSLDGRVPGHPHLPRSCNYLCRKENREFYLKRVKKHLAEYRLLHSYRDLYATEINEILKREMICTPTFIATMRDVYPGMRDEDFNLAFRRTSLDPREINKHRFAKLIIDLHKQIGDEVSPEKWRPKSDEKKSLMEIREEHHKAWEERKCEIDKLVRKWASNPIKTK